MLSLLTFNNVHVSADMSAHDDLGDTTFLDASVTATLQRRDCARA
jgi:hypothetical protein